MLQIENLHATIGDKPVRSGLSRLLLLCAPMLLAACGQAGSEGEAAKAALNLLDPAALTGKLPPEARAVVTSYKNDLRVAAKAHIAEFGQLPTNVADIASVAGARQTAVAFIADGLGEQVPFASRETIEKAAGGIVSAAELQILNQLRTENAPNP